jgi:RND family efflux transporter MFP subunit
VPLLTVMDTTAAIAKTHLPQMAAQALKIGDAAEISVEGVSDPFPAKVTLISPALDANSTTVEVWVTADNRAQRLRPGASAKVDIVGRKANDAIAVPDQALVKTDAGPAVMIAGSDHKAHVRQVEVGIADGRQKLTQISSGLKAGEDVIVNGFGIPDGATVKANEAQPADKAAADEEKGQKKTDNKGQTKGAK